MATVFLLILYLSFSGLGLYNSMLGAVWPVAHGDLGVGLSSAAMVSILITGSTVLGSLLGAKIQKKIGSGKAAFLGLLGIALVCFGFSWSPHFYWLLLFAIPLGFCGGLVDVTLNNYVAQNYPPQFISWLHCCWGLGALLSPIIASKFLAKGQWRGAYVVIAMIQLVFAILLLVTLKCWKKPLVTEVQDDRETPSGSALKIKGVLPAMLTVFFYGGIEASTNFWGSSYLVNTRNVSPHQAAKWISLFFAGIMIARFLAGFIAVKFNYKQIVLVSQILIAMAVLLLFLPLKNSLYQVVFLLLGLGCGPVAPGMLRLVPDRFGKQRSQEIIGMQTAALYAGTMVLPPLTGVLGDKIGMQIFPALLISYIVIVLIASTTVNRVTGKQ